jgi:flagellar biosynthetic protein FliR
MELQVPWVLGYALVLTRTAALFGMVPVLGSHAVPFRIRAALTLTLSLLTYLTAHAPQVAVPDNFASLAGLIASEAALGLAAGLSSRVVFDAAQAGGQLAATGMGFGFGMMINPHTHAESSTVGELMMALTLGAALVFHLPEECIRWLVQSVQRVPPGGTIELEQLASGMTQQLIFGVGLSVRMAIPILGASLLGSAALGAFGRTAPILSLQNVGFAVSIGCGACALFLVAPDAARMCADAATRIFSQR